MKKLLATLFLVLTILLPATMSLAGEALPANLTEEALSPASSVMLTDPSLSAGSIVAEDALGAGAPLVSPDSFGSLSPVGEQSTGLTLPSLPNDPFTWETLATLAGATLATVLIVQLLKLPLDKVWKIPIRLLVYAISLILLLLATAFTTGLTLPTVLLTAVNAVIVALAAMGAYEVTFRKLETK